MIKITIPELKELCKQNGLKGYSKLNKGQLIDYLSSYAESDQGSGLFDILKKIKTFFKKKTPPRQPSTFELYNNIPNPKWDFPMDESDAADIMSEQFIIDEEKYVDDYDDNGRPFTFKDKKKFDELRKKHDNIKKIINSGDLPPQARQIEDEIDQSLTREDYKDILEKHNIHDPVRSWPAQKILWKQYKPLYNYLAKGESGGRKKMIKKSKKGKKMVKKSMKGGRMIGYGKDFYGEGFFNTIKSIAKKIPFTQIANVALQLAQEFLPNGKAKEIVDIAADITNKMVKEKEKEKEKEKTKEIKKEEKILEELEEPKKKIVLRTKRTKAPIRARKVIKSKKPKKY